MNAGEQGSKLRRFTLRRMPFPMELGPNSVSIWAGEDQIEPGESVEVQEVGSRHDEQSEDWITAVNEALGEHRKAAAFVDDAVAIVVARMEKAEAAIAVVEERTVAAVVEALRADDVPTAFKGAFGNAADYIEERFGSSVSGGK